ncbi:hypothetical protein GSI_14919 [Ganoderma sinense ZZ0214-1]|uniref:Uncharacterized protein n=1 Tax=Ganoderma sinense ZZ0214-1 TaxID=1077348 RepID=A0A2G8RQ26_9APHY|nr:hypothetical protein GSI_14919 [Ganoderma sinense ZZ0214-1]
MIWNRRGREDGRVAGMEGTRRTTGREILVRQKSSRRFATGDRRFDAIWVTCWAVAHFERRTLQRCRAACFHRAAEWLWGVWQMFARGPGCWMEMLGYVVEAGGGG